MEKKEKLWIGIIFVLILVLAFYMDLRNGMLQENGTISREEAGGETREVELLLDAEGVLDGYLYELEIEPARVTEEKANQYFAETMATIEAEMGEIDTAVPIKEEYADGLVSAKWQFQPYGYIATNGEIIGEKIPEEGIQMNVQVELVCGEYEKEYSFPLHLEKPTVSEQQSFLSSLSQWMSSQMSREGVTTIQLPKEIQGKKLVWSEKKDYFSLKIVFLEIVAIIFLVIGKKRKVIKEDKLQKMRMEEDYPDVVNQLMVLLGAGMTIRQAWEKIASQYTEKRKKKMIKESPVYERICYMSHGLSEGENERLAYQKFSESIQVLSYRRLMRLLLNNLEKGTKGLCELLEEECRQAYQQQILIAKTKGEEASTKMLLPLMIMMVLVMAIVVMPAIINFAI